MKLTIVLALISSAASVQINAEPASATATKAAEAVGFRSGTFELGDL